MAGRFLREARVLGAVLWAVISGNETRFANAIKRLEDIDRERDV